MKPNGILKCPKRLLASKTGFLHKRISQTHMYGSSQTLGAIQRPEKTKNILKRGPKYKIAYYEAKQDFKAPKIHSRVLKLVCYLKVSPRSICSITVRLQGFKRAKKRAKNRTKSSPKHKIIYYLVNWEIDRTLAYIANN